MSTPIDRFSQQLRVFTEGLTEPCTGGTGASLTKQEARAVVAVARAGPMKMGELAEVLGVVQSGVTALIDRLETGGFVTRDRSREDRRVWLVSATAAGRAVASEEDEAYRALARGLLAPLTDDEQEHLAVLLGRVIAAMGRGEADPE